MSKNTPTRKPSDRTARSSSRSTTRSPSRSSSQASARKAPSSSINKAELKKLGLVVVMILVLTGGLVWYFFGPRSPQLPEQAKILVEPPPDSNAIPHTTEKETVFEASVEYLSPRTFAPKIVVEENIGEGTVAPPHVPKPKVRRAPVVDPETGAVEPVPEPDIPEVVKNWSGVVLVPEVARVSKAYTSSVALSRVEAHPLKDGRLHVWVRMRNKMGYSVEVEKDCRFRAYHERVHNRLGFESVTIPARGYADVMFLSPDASIEEYTILVRLARDKVGEGDEDLL